MQFSNHHLCSKVACLALCSFAFAGLRGQASNKQDMSAVLNTVASALRGNEPPQGQKSSGSRGTPPADKLHPRNIGQFSDPVKKMTQLEETVAQLEGRVDQLEIDVAELSARALHQGDTCRKFCQHPGGGHHGRGPHPGPHHGRGQHPDPGPHPGWGQHPGLGQHPGPHPGLGQHRGPRQCWGPQVKKIQGRAQPGQEEEEEEEEEFGARYRSEKSRKPELHLGPTKRPVPTHGQRRSRP